LSNEEVIATSMGSTGLQLLSCCIKRVQKCQFYAGKSIASEAGLWTIKCIRRQAGIEAEAGGRYLWVSQGAWAWQEQFLQEAFRTLKKGEDESKPPGFDRGPITILRAERSGNEVREKIEESLVRAVWRGGLDRKRLQDNIWG
jgi:hypothetical protein